MLPEKAVFTDKQRQSWIAESPKQHTIEYNSAPMVDFPVWPIQAWALTYDLDIIMVSQHPDWNMHEYAKIQTPDGPLWIMKDAEEGSLDQFITVDVENVDHWLPELPVVRKHYPVKVTDNSTDELINLDFSYENVQGTKIEAHYEGKQIKTNMKKRNGSTMGHSKNQLLVVLDLPHRDFGKKGNISYDGKPYKMNRLLGLVPFLMALQQTQGGFSIGNYSLHKDDDQLRSTHHKGKLNIDQDWSSTEKNNTVIVQQKDNMRTINYEFAKQGESLELQAAYVEQWNRPGESFRVNFYPALPDLRRKFKGAYTSKFVFDINGQKSHAIGSVTAQWDGEKAVLQITPEKPWWVTDRPLKTTISYEEGKAAVNIERR
ncbi:MAG: hypothetical protein GY810_26145 [Aureispira sp.]|nr:hypothetical protein [Aureispira sp.]